MVCSFRFVYRCFGKSCRWTTGLDYPEKDWVQQRPAEREQDTREKGILFYSCFGARISRNNKVNGKKKRKKKKKEKEFETCHPGKQVPTSFAIKGTMQTTGLESILHRTRQSVVHRSREFYNAPRQNRQLSKKVNTFPLFSTISTTIIRRLFVQRFSSFFLFFTFPFLRCVVIDSDDIRREGKELEISVARNRTSRIIDVARL